jgi:hypothetical protein
VAEKKKKPSGKGANSSSTFAMEVARLAADKKFVWDFLEEQFLADPATLESATAAEALGWPRERFLQMRLSQTAVQIDGSKPGTIVDVFQMCGLDPAKPLHWRALLEAMVEVGFKKSGAPVEWDELSYYLLVCDIRELQVLQPQLKEHTEIARQLQNTRPFKQKYKQWEFAYLRKRVSEARKMGPADSLEEFIAKRRENKFDLPAGFAKAYIERASALAAAREGFDPDATFALIEEAEKLVGLKRPK